MEDPTTQSNYLKIASEHVSLEWTIDFDQRVVTGSALHHLLVKEIDVKQLVLDTADLDISHVEIAGKSVTFDVKAKHEVMGSALHIDLPSSVPGQYIDIKIIYKTTKDSTALQWLDKEQTQGKKFPYLFSQCQPIYARALVPVQDTPSVKITYSAKVASVLPVLLSALRISPPSDGPIHDGKVVGKDFVTYTYDQPIPIPPYLLAIASGNVTYRAFPPYEDKQWTSGIWAEPELIDGSYWEFSKDTARFLAAEEKLVTPYQFGVYDLLVLPPSFPFGGMENACLSFLTPTLLTGDRSLVDVVVHELTHSWFGNGVTQANATHFWLNEGWTTYMERLLQEVLHTPAHRGFSYVIGQRELDDALQQYKHRPKYQRLVIDFNQGEDPDDAYSVIAYEKGANLLLHLERTLGGLHVFLPYVKDYVNMFMGKSITTQQWKDHLYDYFQNHGGKEKIELLDSIDWNAWFYGEGLKLPVELQHDMTLTTQAYELAARWDASRMTENTSRLDFKYSDLKEFNSNQIIVFLQRLQAYIQLPPAHITHLGRLYRFATTPNAEIRLRFYELALKDPTSRAAKDFAVEAASWVVGNDGTGVIKGRMKFCRPVLRAVCKVDRDLAVSVFGGKKDAFHPIARKMIEKDLGMAQ